MSRKDDVAIELARVLDSGETLEELHKRSVGLGFDYIKKHGEYWRKYIIKDYVFLAVKEAIEIRRQQQLERINKRS